MHSLRFLAQRDRHFSSSSNSTASSLPSSTPTSPGSPTSRHNNHHIFSSTGLFSFGFHKKSSAGTTGSPSDCYSAETTPIDPNPQYSGFPDQGLQNSKQAGPQKGKIPGSRTQYLKRTKVTVTELGFTPTTEERNVLGDAKSRMCHPLNQLVVVMVRSVKSRRHWNHNDIHNPNNRRSGNTAPLLSGEYPQFYHNSQGMSYNIHPWDSPVKSKLERMLGAPISNDMYEPVLPMISRRGSRRTSGRRSQRLSFPWRKQEHGSQFSYSDLSVEGVRDDNESDTSEYTDHSDDLIESGSDDFPCSLAPRPELSINQLNPICEKTKFEPSHFTTYKLTHYKSNSTDGSKTESDCEEVSEFGPEEDVYPRSEASLFIPPPPRPQYRRSQSTIGLQRRTSIRRIDQARHRRKSSGQSDGPRTASSLQTLRQPLTVNTDLPPSPKNNQESQKTIDHSWSYLDLIPSPDESEATESGFEYPAISITRPGEPSSLNTLTSPSDTETSLFSPTDSVGESSSIASFHCVGIAPGSIRRPSTTTFRRRSSLFQTVINTNNRHSIQSTTTIESEVSSSPPPIRLRIPSQRSTANHQRIGQRSPIPGVPGQGLRSRPTFPPRTSSYSYIPSTGNNTSPLTTSSNFTDLHRSTIETIDQNQWRHPDYNAEQWLNLLHDQPEIAAMYHSTTNYGSRSSPSLHTNTNTPIPDSPRPRQPPPCAGLPANPRPQKSRQQNPKPYPTHPAYRPQIHKPLPPHPHPPHNQNRWRLPPVSIPQIPPPIPTLSPPLLSQQQEQASPRSTHHYHYHHYHIFGGATLGRCRLRLDSTEGEEDGEVRGERDEKETPGTSGSWGWMGRSEKV